MLIALGIKNVLQFSHLRWDEGLEQYRQKHASTDDWMLVFSRALDIYVGRVKGFRDVPEEMNMRKEYLKGELKVFIANIIGEQLQKWALERINKAGKKVEPKAPSPVKQEVEYNPFDNSDNPFLADNPYAAFPSSPKKSIAKSPQIPQVLDETSADILSSLKELGDDAIMDE